MDNSTFNQTRIHEPSGDRPLGNSIGALLGLIFCIIIIAYDNGTKMMIMQRRSGGIGRRAAHDKCYNDWLALECLMQGKNICVGSNPTFSAQARSTRDRR